MGSHDTATRDLVDHRMLHNRIHGVLCGIVCDGSVPPRQQDAKNWTG